jgi:hypothetical protein
MIPISGAGTSRSISIGELGVEGPSPVQSLLRDAEGVDAESMCGLLRRDRRIANVVGVP